MRKMILTTLVMVTMAASLVGCAQNSGSFLGNNKNGAVVGAIVGGSHNPASALVGAYVGGHV